MPTRRSHRSLPDAGPLPADPRSALSDLDAAFGCTRWSLVVALRDPDRDPGQRGPLDELSRSYSYPVYAYLRRRGHPPDTAARLLGGFFARLGNELKQVDPALSGRFRAFLLERLQAFADQQTLLAPLSIPTPAGIDCEELEQRLQAEHAAAAGPDAVFARSFALQVIARGRAQLREEAQRSQREAMFDLLERYLTREPDAGRVEQLAGQLGIGALAVRMAIKRLRQRFRQLVEAELQETVSSPADLDAERTALHQILARSP